MSTMTIAIPKAERNSINLRPFLSDNFPQKGAAMAEKRKVILKATPVHRFKDS